MLLGGYYQNLGDLAITVAQTEFLKKSFPDYEVIAVPSTKTYQYMKSIKRSLTDKDIITVSGGGNMSDGYVSLEYARRFAVRNLKNNPVVSFPQTFDFSNSYYGRHIKNGSVKIYNSNKNFYAFAREAFRF